MVIACSSVHWALSRFYLWYVGMQQFSINMQWLLGRLVSIPSIGADQLLYTASTCWYLSTSKNTCYTTDARLIHAIHTLAVICTVTGVACTFAYHVMCRADSMCMLHALCSGTLLGLCLLDGHCYEHAWMVPKGFKWLIMFINYTYLQKGPQTL